MRRYAAPCKLLMDSAKEAQRQLSNLRPMTQRRRGTLYILLTLGEGHVVEHLVGGKGHTYSRG